MNSYEDAEKVKEELDNKYSASGITVQTWFDLHKDLYSVMLVERWTAFIILTLIVIVATFNLLGSLTMTVIEKTRDIGILKSMGAQESAIRNIFRFEGIIIGIIGAILGCMLAYIVCWAQIHYHWFPLDETVYIIPALPVEMRISDFLIVSISTFLLCYLATLYPSTRAAKLLSAEAIRWE
ncbi:MAG: ABC transporter permease [Bacteroidetes bacterium]|nr:ABC transporter permease [Bacteroidota bacterium]